MSVSTSGARAGVAALAFGAAALLFLPAPVAAQAPSLLHGFGWRNIGPANMAGRVTDIEAVESNPAIVYVAAASGGLWKSVNAGTTWDPVFTGYGTANMGDVAVFQPNPDIVWVGTGESCVRNSVGWGDGVYKSTDGGKTFVNMGLRDTHHISEVVTHPENPDVVYVAAQGHLWGNTGERGIFKTTDGGKNWQLLSRGLPNGGRVGASDLVMDPSNPEILYAAFWERIREPHRFTSGGIFGGIYKSTDGGASWQRLSTGLPAGPTGKIGLAISKSDPNILMAIVEHGFQPARNTPDYADMTKLGNGMYRTEDGGATWTFVSRFNNRPFYYSHIFLDPRNPNRVYVLTGNAQISEDGGRTFVRQMEGISGDFHALWIDPANSDRFYVGNDKGAYATYDGGARFQMFDNMDIGQFYAVTLDNRDPYWAYGGLQDNGNWGGPSNSRDLNGVLNDHWFKFHAGDGFHTTVDPNDWRTVYTEAQGGRIRRLDAVFRQLGRDITPNASTVLNLAEAVPGVAAGRGPLPRSSFRFNWSTPLVLSPHDSKTLYYGGNYLFRSTDRGDTWTIISPDLSTRDTAFANPETGGLTRDVTGAETHATAITISESPILPGVIWVGTDDGNIQLTRNGGRTWSNTRSALRGVPPFTWVSRVTASRFDPATAYVTLDGHRRDDFRPYVFKTTDYGATWTSVAGNLPAGSPVYVITEGLRNPRLLFVGTETAAWYSIDGGANWTRFLDGLPTVPVHDLVIHPREHDLVAATHGRSVWVFDNMGPLDQLTDSILAAPLHLFEQKTATRWLGVTRGGTRGHMFFAGRNPLTIAQQEPANSPPELENSATIDFYAGGPGPVRLEITDLAAGNRFTADLEAVRGINRYLWNLRFNPPAGAPARETPADPEAEGFGRRRNLGPEAGPGTYRIRITAGDRTVEGMVSVRADPGTGVGN
ncbi:MAG: WD40/YVTN/BNR-like repeat-containing protein [Gemmatimonadales bacterium]